MPSFKLHYFDTRGRAEIARLMFHAAGQKFEDCRYAGDAWADFKPKTPFGQMPCLEVDGTIYGQSGAIFSYLARELGLYGKGNMEALDVDVVLGLMGDFGQIMIKVFFLEKDEDKQKELTAKLIAEDAPKYLGYFESLVGKDGYFVGGNLTLADIAVFNICDYLIEQKGDILDSFPKVKANRKLVESNSGIGEYIKTRK